MAGIFPCHMFLHYYTTLSQICFYSQSNRIIISISVLTIYADNNSDYSHNYIHTFEVCFVLFNPSSSTRCTAYTLNLLGPGSDNNKNNFHRTDAVFFLTKPSKKAPHSHRVHLLSQVVDTLNIARYPPKTGANAQYWRNAAQK